MNTETLTKNPTKKEWTSVVKKYRKPEQAKSAWQLANTLIPYIGLVALMYFSLAWSYWITLLLAVPAAGFAVRLFVLAHDCGHGAFFKSKKVSDFWGRVCSFFVWTPYGYWRAEHARHHAHSGNLDERGVGDIWTLTIDEYRGKPWSVRVLYRIYRNPVVLFVALPLFLFTVKYRFWDKWARKKDKLSVVWTNLAIIALFLIVHVTIGISTFLLIQVPITALAAAGGVWLFYVQHQFEDMYWEESENWDFFEQAVDGSSLYRLPKILQFFSGSIGYHHIHHLSPGIPNYELETCHKENEMFHRAHEITLASSLECMRFRMWDKENRKMVGFEVLRGLEPLPEAEPEIPLLVTRFLSPVGVV